MLHTVFKGQQLDVHEAWIARKETFGECVMH